MAASEARLAVVKLLPFGSRATALRWSMPPLACQMHYLGAWRKHCLGAWQMHCLGALGPLLEAAQCLDGFRLGYCACPSRCLGDLGLSFRRLLQT